MLEQGASSSLTNRHRGTTGFGAATLLMLVVGTLDWLAGYDVSLFIFYGLPIGLVVSRCNRGLAVLMALMCALTWWWVDAFSGHPYYRSWLAIWEPAMRFAYFGIVAVMGSRLRAQHDALRSRVALLEHAQRLEKEIVHASEAERRRVGRDLHDGICQYLAGIGCAASSLASELRHNGAQISAARADEIGDLLKDAVIQTRDLARGLVPVEMEQAGLPSTLQQLANSVSRLQKINCEFVLGAAVPLCSGQAGLHLYRIAQEAVANAIRHGRATEIEIYLTESDGISWLRISDNGCGITAESPKSNGMGLKIMDYRARLIAGSITIERVAAGGTEVTCSFNEPPIINEDERTAA
ncbi:MAG: sensor histidine kinase [Chthoniobacterales bacterium]